MKQQYERSYALEEITRSKVGDGRTVTAYAAMFDAAYEVRDQYGHYFETINRAAFDAALAKNGLRGVAVLYNHGLNLAGQPADRYQQPLGKPLEVRPDSRGLLTVTRYAKTQDADDVLELIDIGAITAQSFRGPIYRSEPDRPHSSGLKLVERSMLGLKDYGPTTFAMNPNAEILSVRSVAELQEEIAEMTEEERRQLLEALNSISATPAGPESTEATPQPEPAPQPQPAPEQEVAPADGPALSELELRVAKLRHEAA